MVISKCMKCGAKISGHNCVYVLATDRTPDPDVVCGHRHKKFASATLCRKCGMEYRYIVLRWMEGEKR